MPTVDDVKKNLPAGVSAPAIRAFAAEGLHTLQDFTTVTEQHVRGLHGVGPKVVRIITEAMTREGLSFKQ